MFAAAALGRIDSTAARESLAYLRWRLETPAPKDSRLPDLAMRALGDLGPIGRDAGPDLARLMIEMEPGHRNRAVHTLRQIAADQEVVVDALTAVLLDDRLPYRETVAKMAGRTFVLPLLTGRAYLRTPSVAYILREVNDLADFRQQIRRDAIDALTAIGPKARTALPALKRFAGDSQLKPFVDKAVVAIDGAR